MGNRADPFAFTKAIHKAQRNAVKQLLPVPVIREVLNFYLRRKATHDATEQPQTEQSNHDTISNAQKAAFAIANKLTPALEKADVSKEMLWEYVKHKYEVDSRNDMTELQWTELAAQLNAAQTTPEIFDQLVKNIGR